MELHSNPELFIPQTIQRHLKSSWLQTPQDAVGLIQSDPNNKNLELFGANRSFALHGTSRYALEQVLKAGYFPNSESGLYILPHIRLIQQYAHIDQDYHENLLQLAPRLSNWPHEQPHPIDLPIHTVCGYAERTHYYHSLIRDVFGPKVFTLLQPEVVRSMSSLLIGVENEREIIPQFAQQYDGCLSLKKNTIIDLLSDAVESQHSDAGIILGFYPEVAQAAAYCKKGTVNQNAMVNLIRGDDIDLFIYLHGKPIPYFFINSLWPVSEEDRLWIEEQFAS